MCDLAGRDRYDYALLPYWNGLVTFAIFGAAVFLLSALGEERRFARTCSLTGLLNRRGFFEAAALELERCGRYGRPVSLGFFDCDDFKQVNDVAGHETGDEVLARIGELLRVNLRESDLCGRLGGDEFAVLLPETGPEAARLAFTKLTASMDGAMRAMAWPVTLSAGVVSYRVPPSSPDELLRRADRLMYQVKSAGKNGIEFEEVEFGGETLSFEGEGRPRAFRS
jgi:diguanylate cyclase (GGDEF)-like protein